MVTNTELEDQKAACNNITKEKVSIILFKTPTKLDLYFILKYDILYFLGNLVELQRKSSAMTVLSFEGERLNSIRIL